ncbi:MAG: response regulator, partial [Planctomycetaceae bacterium]|nr:response regulator [Planctomycetaceae bacterium]
MPDGGSVFISAHVTSDATGDGPPGVRLTIADDGPGFDRQQLSRVFEPYYSTRSDGHGLGLTTCYFVVDSHGGRIEATNVDSGGAEISIWLPVTTATAADDAVRQPAMAPQPATILLLDDEDVVRQSVSMMLELDDHTVLAAANGEQALALAEGSSSPVQLALLDLTVRGGLGGLEIVQRLKQHSPNTHCVAMSGYSDRQVMSRPQQFGFDAVLPKPFTREQICGLVASALRHDRPRP